MKLLDVTEFFSERGGGVRSHLTLKGHILCQAGHEHIVVGPGPKKTEWMGQTKLVRVGGPTMPYDPSYHFLWRADSVRAVIVRERPDVLEIHSPYVAALGAMMAPRSSFGTRTFYWHSDFIDTYRQVLLAKKVLPRAAADVVARPLWAWVRQIGRACDATIAASSVQVEKLRAHGVPRVVHLPFGVDKQVFHPREPSAALRRSLGVRDEDALVVGVGRFAVEKHWEVAIEAFLKLRELRPAKLVLFGDGPERARMERAAGGSDDVTFVGFEKDRTKLALALSSADVLVHACPHETFGISIAEAICAGLAVVVPDEGGASELAKPGCGERYRTDDAADCALALDRMLTRDRGATRRAAIAASDGILDVRDHFDRLIALYTDLIAKNTARAADRR